MEEYKGCRVGVRGRRDVNKGWRMQGLELEGHDGVLFS